MRTVYNQYDSMVRPLQKWLEERGVKSEFNTSVTNLGFCHDAEGYIVDRILCESDGHRDEIKVRDKDCVIVPLGSMTEASSLGSMDSAPILRGKCDGGSWALWEKIADGHPAITSMNRSGFPSPLLSTTQPSSALSGSSRAIFQAKAALSPSRSLTGWCRSYYLTNHISSDSPRRLMSSGGTDSSSIGRANS